MKAARTLLLVISLVGCAPLNGGAAAPLGVSRARAPQPNERVANAQSTAAAAVGETSVSDSALAEAGASLAAVEQQFAAGSFEPETIHAARIEMARRALVEDSLAKERTDVEEELERELATLQNGQQTGKSRRKHTTTWKHAP